jgi:hypothetical protein
MPETETPTPPRRGRPPKPKVKPPPGPVMEMDPEVVHSAAAVALDAGEPRESVAQRLHIKDADMDKIEAEVAEAEEARDTRMIPRRKMTPQELALAREVDGKTLQRVVFLAVQGRDFRWINRDLVKKNLHRLTPTQYSMICNLPQVLASREALMMIGLERGIGNKMKRIQTLSDLAGGVASRLKLEMKKDKPDTALVKVLLPEYREYSKEVSIETGERVENLNIEGLLRQMSPREILALAEVQDGEIIEGDFGEAETGEDDMEDREETDA